MLSPLLPVSVSAKTEPVRFSMLLSVSVPAPPVSCAVGERQAHRDAAVAPA